jgi:hypothetical protein
MPGRSCSADREDSIMSYAAFLTDFITLVSLLGVVAAYCTCTVLSITYIQERTCKATNKIKRRKRLSIGLTYRMKLKASKKPVILEYVTAVAITGTIFSILSGSFRSGKIDFTPKGIDAKLMSE